MMLTVSIVFGVVMLQMFLLLGGVIGYLAYGHLAARAEMLPQHPEFYDAEGNLIPDEVYAIRFEHSYEQPTEWEEED